MNESMNRSTLGYTFSGTAVNSHSGSVRGTRKCRYLRRSRANQMSVTTNADTIEAKIPMFQRTSYEVVSMHQTVESTQDIFNPSSRMWLFNQWLVSPLRGGPN